MDDLYDLYDECHWCGQRYEGIDGYLVHDDAAELWTMCPDCYAEWCAWYVEQN